MAEEEAVELADGPDGTAAKPFKRDGRKEPETNGQGTDLLDAVGRNQAAIDSILGRVHEMMKDTGTRRASMGRLSSWLLFSFMVVIVVGTGFLVYEGRVSDGSFTFLIGVMIGSLVQFIGRLDLGGSE